MKKPIKWLGVILAASMMLPAAGCRLKSRDESKSPRKTTVEDTEETDEEETEKTKKTKATTEETEDESQETKDTKNTKATDDPSDPTDSTKATSATSDSDAPPLLGSVPAENCKIEFKKEDQRYHYDMDLKLDEKENTIGGHVEFAFFNDSDEDWDKLCLRDYSSLFIDAATAGYDGALKTNGATTKIDNITDGRSGSTIKMERDKDVSVVWLTLEKKLAPGEKMTLSYDFEAKIPTVADRYGVQDGVFNLTNFYPILAEYTKDGWSHEKFYNCGECFYSEISDYDVKITTNYKMILLTTGLENGEEKKNGKVVHSYHADCVRDFVFCASEDFIIVEGDYENTHIRVAYVKEMDGDIEQVLADECLRAAKDSLKAFNSALGEYPYKDLEVVLAPIDAGGMEYPNLVIITKEIPEGLENNKDYMDFYISYLADSVVSHEIGHQWFMGIVGSNSGTQPWLDESITSFTEYIYDMAVNPGNVHNDADMFKQGSRDDFENMLKQNDFVPINRSYFQFSQEVAYIYGAYTFGKEACIEMSDAVGLENFYGILREYVQRNAFTNADQTDFFSVLYELAGKDNEELNHVIEVFFDESVQPDKIA